MTKKEQQRILEQKKMLEQRRRLEENRRLEEQRYMEPAPYERIPDNYAIYGFLPRPEPIIRPSAHIQLSPITVPLAISPYPADNNPMIMSESNRNDTYLPENREQKRSGNRTRNRASADKYKIQDIELPPLF